MVHPGIVKRVERNMTEYFTRFMAARRPAFAREAASSCFLSMFTGPILRRDNLDLTSLERTSALSPECYYSLFNVFRSSA